MKEYKIKWCEDSGMYWCPVTKTKSYFVGVCLYEITKDLGYSYMSFNSESHNLSFLKCVAVIKLIDIETFEELGWDYYQRLIDEITNGGNK